MRALQNLTKLFKSHPTLTYAEMQGTLLAPDDAVTVACEALKAVRNSSCHPCMLMPLSCTQNTTLTTLYLGKLTQKQCFQMYADSAVSAYLISQRFAAFVVSSCWRP